MPRIILLLLVLMVLGYFIYRFKRLPGDKKSLFLKRAAVAAALVVLAGLAFTGRLNWLVAAFGALIPLIPRVARLVMSYGPSLLPFLKRYQQNKQSRMQTSYIKLHIDMLTGELNGEVLSGEFAGQHLKNLNKQQMLQLLDELKQLDAESVSLLFAYLQHQHPEWVEEQSHETASTDSIMDEQQARDILGVSKNASKEEIIKAHKTLIQRLHPDRGGSDYLAQQINRARQTLLDLL